MQRKVGIGIIGLGMASAPHAKSLLDLKDCTEVVAAFSPNSKRRGAFAAAYGFPVSDSAEAIFDDPAVETLLLLTRPTRISTSSAGPPRPASIYCSKNPWKSAWNAPRNL